MKAIELTDAELTLIRVSISAKILQIGDLMYQHSDDGDRFAELHQKSIDLTNLETKINSLK